METPQGLTTENPVTISIVGTGSGTGGGMAPTQNGTIAKTPGYQPDLKIQVITPVVAIAVRFGHLYFKSLAAAVALALGTGTDFGHAIAICYVPALAVPGVGLIWDIVTVFSRLEGKYPLATGSI